ncbi:IS4 family transposase [Roseimaritima multifibrata]|uniref:IS4 family transposase n=1 Tax=Roseimaritima multifibrata TaxID=1930274 RepID=UPI001C54DB6E|nr:IS4 family transposase [Roseimaritima multifibrata]
MSSLNNARFRRQISFLRRQFLQDGESAFANILADSCIAEALRANDVQWRDRIFSPMVTLWVFLIQVLSADHSCRAAVARLVAHRVSQGKPSCSAETGAYCQARKRIPEKFFADVVRKTGHATVEAADTAWRWKERRVLMFDGTTVTMPDTAENQSDYPQNSAQKPGLGFPIARIAALLSLSCGAVLDLRICKYAGKGQSELGMLRQLMGVFSKGDVLLADRLMCSWREIAMLKARSVDSVTRLSAKRTADFRCGRRIGKDDHIVRWPKPVLRATDPETDCSLPDFLEIRETRVRVEQAGFCTVCIIIVTTLLDSDEITKDGTTNWI